MRAEHIAKGSELALLRERGDRGRQAGVLCRKRRQPVEDVGLSSTV
jgi:hypothetical protein